MSNSFSLSLDDLLGPALAARAEAEYVQLYLDQAYDPAFAYESAVIVQRGLERMYGPKPEDVFYYITLYNENYAQPKRPDGVTDEDILRGLGYSDAELAAIARQCTERENAANRGAGTTRTAAAAAILALPVLR